MIRLQILVISGVRAKKKVPPGNVIKERKLYHPESAQQA